MGNLINGAMGVCESTENDGDDDQQYSAAAVSTSGATAFAVKNSSVFEDVECISDPSRRLTVGEEYDLKMDSTTLHIMDGDNVMWSISYFDIIAWGSSTMSFKLVLKLSKKDLKSPRATKAAKGQKEPTFDVKFRTYSGKRMAVCIRTYCLDLLMHMEDAEADKKIKEKEKEWEAIMNRPDHEKGNDDTGGESEEKSKEEAGGQQEDAAQVNGSDSNEMDELDMMDIRTLAREMHKE